MCMVALSATYVRENLTYFFSNVRRLRFRPGALAQRFFTGVWHGTNRPTPETFVARTAFHFNSTCFDSPKTALRAKLAPKPGRNLWHVTSMAS